MATRSAVGIVNPDNTVRSVYIHWDGYPEGVGKELLANFTTPEIINARLDKGDGSSLYDGFYKDRGEDNVDALTYASPDEFLLTKDYEWVDYRYLFIDGTWKYLKNKGRADQLRDLAEDLANPIED